MDFLKKIRQKIDEFCFNHMRMDGAAKQVCHTATSGQDNG